MIPYFEDDSAVIYCGDCREILPTLAPVDLVLTDPPYGIGESGQRSKDRIRADHPRWNGARARIDASDWDQPIDQTMFDQLITLAPRAIIWGGNFYATPRASCWLVWDKDRTGDFADAELAFTTLNSAVRLMRFRWNGFIQEPGIHKQIREHLTEKPIPLMRWCLGLAKDARSVIDPFMGSGTTLRAAKDCGVKSIGIDISEKYCEIAARRLAQEVLPIW